MVQPNDHLGGSPFLEDSLFLVAKGNTKGPAKPFFGGVLKRHAHWSVETPACRKQLSLASIQGKLPSAFKQFPERKAASIANGRTPLFFRLPTIGLQF